MKDVDRIQIRKVYACCPGWHSGGGHKSAPVSHKHILSHPSFSSPLINEDLLAGPQLEFTLNNRFSATKHVTVCFQPSQADRRTASLVYVNIRSLVISIGKEGGLERRALSPKSQSATVPLCIKTETFN